VIGKLKDQQGSKLTNNASWLIEKIKKQYQLWYNLILCLAILNLNINLIWKILIIIIRKWEKKNQSICVPIYFFMGGKKDNLLILLLLVLLLILIFYSYFNLN
jgi:hypothetical protein